MKTTKTKEKPQHEKHTAAVLGLASLPRRHHPKEKQNKVSARA
jgi:hypothetical protein